MNLQLLNSMIITTIYHCGYKHGTTFEWIVCSPHVDTDSFGHNEIRTALTDLIGRGIVKTSEDHVMCGGCGRLKEEKKRYYRLAPADEWDEL